MSTHDNAAPATVAKLENLIHTPDLMLIRIF
jgi:hypothetical protein